MAAQNLPLERRLCGNFPGAADRLLLAEPATPRLVEDQTSRHRLGEDLVVHAESVLAGWHHEYSLVAATA
jgi:hypothetical protein